MTRAGAARWEQLVERWRGRAEPPRARDAWFVAAAALGVRVLVVLGAATRFPPADDGAFYHVVASRIARGLGYTWLWPDGAVTYAAHYPVGYPALIGAFYALIGAVPAVAMGVNAVVGAVAAFSAHALAGRTGSRRGALLAGLCVAFEPALVLYTPALMTEAVAGELLLVATALATAPRPSATWRAVLASLVLGLALLVRPQLLLVTPFVGALVAWRSADARASVRAACAVTALAVTVCVPWTLRNCARLDTCAFVSANGGWNLFIGSSPVGEGGWAPLERIGVPTACRAVFGEGEKDRCFGRAGVAVIAEHPLAWLALAPKKLAVTFDYGTAAAHYLATSNPTLVTESVKTAIGALELFGQRVLLVAASLALGFVAGPRSVLRRRLTPVGVVLALVPFAWTAWLCLVVQGLALGRALTRLPSVLLAVATVATTAFTHAVFFGAGRYALVCVPALATLAGLLGGAPAKDAAEA
ncbi:MAG TPA: hypothetical protein VMI54_18050 [Polyangiaceae bacterium]|nr:hypothetical protein [Polyangiaceae bacterium]